MLRAIDKWLIPYLFRIRRPRVDAVTDVLLCVCDHFEPRHGTSETDALKRVARWQAEFPKLAGAFRDADGCAPAQTFFYPIEQYRQPLLEGVADLCRTAHCETEIHLHHDRDTAANLRATLEDGKARLASHGLLSRDDTGAVRFAFIHGNWALDDSHPTGRFCGVRTELDVLAQAGCYADFTMPSAPDPTQTRMVNSIYYATDTPAPKSHDCGVAMRVRGLCPRAPAGGTCPPGPPEGDSRRQGNAVALPPRIAGAAGDKTSEVRDAVFVTQGWGNGGNACNAEQTTQPGSGAAHTSREDRGESGRPPAAGGKQLLLVQGPLGLNWRRRKWGVLPRLENGDLSRWNPPRPDRMRLWLDLGVHVHDRPEWVVVKLHTHGGLPRNMDVLLGAPMRQFHEHLAAEYNDGTRFRLHYVTARELVNILHAAEAGQTGNPGAFRDFRYRRGS